MEPEFVIKVDLYSEKAQSLEVVTLTFPTCPATFLEIQDKIEEAFCIPVPVQTLFLQNTPLPTDCSPSSFYLRSGDVMRVQYPSKSLAKEVKNVIKWLREVTDIIDKTKELNLDQTISALTVEHFSLFTDPRADDLFKKLFTPWSNPASQVNGVHFTSIGGVKLLTKLHRQIIDLREKRFHNCLRNLIGYMEFVCCETCANFSMNQKCARNLAQCGGLDNCVDTFLMMPANNKSLKENNFASIIEVALCAILNISEIPDVQLNLSSRRDVLEQAFLAGHSEMYPTNTPVMAISFLLCISRCQEAHGNLLTPFVVESILELCDKPGAISSTCEIKSLKCYAGVALSQMILGSTSLLQMVPSLNLEGINKLMKLVCTFLPEDIREYETKQRLYWGTFSSCVQYLYMPDQTNTTESSSIIQELCFHSIEILLLYLQNALGRKIHVDIVIEEGLLDFIVTLPWTVPDCLKARARAVIRELLSFQSINPPSFSAISKAKLAKHRWGLKKWMELHSLSQLYDLT